MALPLQVKRKHRPNLSMGKKIVILASVIKKNRFFLLCLLAFFHLSLFADDPKPVWIYHNLSDGSKIAYGIYPEPGKDTVNYQEAGSKDWKTLVSGKTLSWLKADSTNDFSSLPSRVRASKVSQQISFAIYETNEEEHTSFISKGKSFHIPTRYWSAINANHLQNKKEDYLLITMSALDSSPTETILVRHSDDKSIRISSSFLTSENLAKYSITDKIFELSGIQRRFDLEHFEAENNFPSVADSTNLLSEKGEVINTHDAVNSQLIDLVEAAKKRPQDFPEKANPELLNQIAESLRSGRSAVILGAPGVGKSSTIRALAREVSQGKVSGIPRTLRIYEVPANYFNSDARTAGTTERKADTLIWEAKKGATIFFQDEFHGLVGQGTHRDQPNDVTQAFKTPMEKGEFQWLGTDTDNEYSEAFAKDPAFQDRIDSIQQIPPTPGELKEIVAIKLKSKGYADVPPDMIDYGIRLSNLYDIHSGQPRSSINLLRKALAKRDSNPELKKSPLSRELIEETTAEKYNFPKDFFVPEKVVARLEKLGDHLKEEIIGMEEAKEIILSLWERKLSGVGALDDINSAIFVGPPGTGKTLVAEVSAEHMGYKKLRIEMNKFRSIDVESFRREIYSALLKSPFHVFILDEFEKAPLQIQEAALAILQDGKFSVKEILNRGERVHHVNAQHSLFLLTSNASGDLLQENQLTENKIRSALVVGGISKPIASRIQEIAVVRQPTKKQFLAGIKLYLDKTLKRESQKDRGGAKKQFVFQNREEFLKEFEEKFESGMDYRDIKRIIRKEIERTIAKSILHKDFPKSSQVELTRSNGRTTFCHLETLSQSP